MYRFNKLDKKMKGTVYEEDGKSYTYSEVLYFDGLTGDETEEEVM